ncbi:MAG TPA: hypothetical protein DG761_00685 [Gammaproteobacteria bacterium]|jgi:FKBP-type peptidyl-prolyl cis-trans isomerase SlpA|nr:hypothetical protein [Acidiferrobacteraceae bacterium]MDP6552453.1 hypothetical protein [Arenicellales bacterium]MDP6792090.1 hypothetical protein [Arenicellales bacterium]MDP6918267.1 hypothetical protein [Arenicellales bacterium]HCX86520.1 hypothetical protein [Gammaproteobacteria bacterium]|tara:strand:- start:662 stop:1126 length:465 start_codon:yes stop_codon:yes gene_type:complete
MKTVKTDDALKIRYRIINVEGATVEDSGDESITIVVGDDNLPLAVNRQLAGSRLGDHLRIDISAAQNAFGTYDHEKIQPIARSEFAAVGSIEIGMLVEFSMPNDEVVAGQVIGLDDDRVSVDFNHPLIGRDCVYEIDVVGFAETVTTAPESGAG